MSAGPRIPTRIFEMTAKTIKLKSLRNDVAKEREGEWVPSRAFPGAEFLVKSTNCPEYVASRQEEMRRIQEMYRDKAKLDQDQVHIDEAKSVCRHLLRGWKGFDTEYSEDIALAELMDIGQAPLVNDILDCASRVGRYKIAFVEDDLKNL
jgi:hypothetical protein